MDDRSDDDSDESGLKDADEITYEYFFDPDFKSFNLCIDAPKGKGMEIKELAAALRSFADGIEDGEFKLYLDDETSLH